MQIPVSCEDPDGQDHISLRGIGRNAKTLCNANALFHTRMHRDQHFHHLKLFEIAVQHTSASNNAMIKYQNRKDLIFHEFKLFQIAIKRSSNNNICIFHLAIHGQTF